MYIFVTLVLFFLFYGLVSYLLKRRRLQLIMAMFRRYNSIGEVGYIEDWIRAKRGPARLLETLDYLEKIEERELALQVLSRFDLEAFPQRHIRVLACRLFTNEGLKEKALALAEALMAAYPKDDSILDLYFHVHLSFDQRETIRELLLERIGRKYEGTIFARHYARFLAAEGDLAKAVAIMTKVEQKDFMLYKNTFAQPHKKLIYDQYVESNRLLEEFKRQLAEGTGRSS